MKVRYVFDAASVCVLAAVAFWFAVPSSLFIDPSGIEYEAVDGQWIGHFSRVTPFGSARITFTQRMTPSPTIEGEAVATCTHSRTEPAEHSSGIITFIAPDHMRACLEAERPVFDRIIVYAWLGPIRLRPVTLESVHE